MMDEITDKEAAMLVTLIYRPELEDDFDTVLKELKGRKCTVKDLIDYSETELQKQNDNDKCGAEMNKAEFQEVINKIKTSETIMSLEIENIENNDQTYFRAMTLKPSANSKEAQNGMKPIVVFRGTAGNYQWDDNLSATVSSLTPSQREAQQYVIKSGYEHLTVVGHSKGGNMAASMAYLLPEGMVDKVYSLDGQGESNLFLSNIPLSKQQYAKKRVFNINEYRDIVSQLLNKTGDDANTKYVDSGIDFGDTEYSWYNLKMRVFHAHKPNYFLLGGASYVEKAYTPALVGQISNKIDMTKKDKDKAIHILKGFAEKLHGEEEVDTKWNYQMWDAVYEAEKVYNKTNSERKTAILSSLSTWYNIDFLDFELVQEDDSFVVEGAILTCPYCNGVGALEQVENRTALEQGKPKAAKTDCIPWKNISMNNLECSLRRYQNPDTVCKCELTLNNQWILTDSSIKVDINGSGKEMEAVLKKSILGCFKGGWIEVVQNGQLKGTDYQAKAPNVVVKPVSVKDKIVNGIQDSINDAVEQAADLRDAYIEKMIDQKLSQYY